MTKGRQRGVPACDLLEAATTDENYRAMSMFFSEARRHLALNGRMLLFFGTAGFREELF